MADLSLDRYLDPAPDERDAHGGFRCSAVLLVQSGARPIVKRLFSVLLHRIMAKPEVSTLRQPRHRFSLADQRVAPRGKDAVECLCNCAKRVIVTG